MKISIQSLYVIQALFNFGLIFMIGYLTLLLSEHYRRQGKVYANAIGGAGITLALTLIMGLMAYMDLTGIPEGRYILVGYIAFFYGFWPSLGSVVWLSLASVVLQQEYSFLGFIALMPEVFVFTYLRHMWLKKGFELRIRWIILGILLASSLAIGFGVILFKDREVLAQVVPMIPFLYGISIFMLLGLSMATVRELERTKSIEKLKQSKLELTQQNFELQALYEEMAAAEETLRDNYDALNIYKERVEYYAFHNPQTGFYNRDYLLEQLNHHFQEGRFEPYYLVVLSIHNMSHYSQTLGQSLVEIMDYLVGIQISKTFEPLAVQHIYSLSSGCYGVLINNSHSQEAIEAAYEELECRLEKTLILENLEILVDVRAGGTLIQSTDLAPHQHLELAELTMRHASRASSTAGFCWFTEIMAEQRHREQQLERHLRQAVALNELYPVYQPQMDSRHRVIGFEALVRWENPELGTVSPALFIPIAENIGCIDLIDQFMLSQVLEHMKAGYFSNLPVSINVSFLELMNPNFSQNLIEKLAQENIDPSRLHLEITETAISDAYDLVSQNIELLSNKGLHFHLDDFGTGYSSLKHLSRFPVSILKIDKSFIDDIDTLPKMKQLVEMTIQYAHKMGMKVVAEGVETEAQVHCLTDIGCDYFQGYYFERPLPSDKLILWMQDKRQLEDSE